METLGVLELAPVTSTHTLVINTSHMARSNINKVGKYIPPTMRRAEGSKYLLNNLPQDPTLFFLDGHVY